MTAYYYLAIAICAEVIATVSMKAVKGFSTPLPLVLVIVGYGIAFWMLTLVVRSVPVKSSPSSSVKAMSKTNCVSGISAPPMASTVLVTVSAP